MQDFWRYMLHNNFGKRGKDVVQLASLQPILNGIALFVARPDQQPFPPLPPHAPAQRHHPNRYNLPSFRPRAARPSALQRPQALRPSEELIGRVPAHAQAVQERAALAPAGEQQARARSAAHAASPSQGEGAFRPASLLASLKISRHPDLLQRPRERRHPRVFA